MKQILDFINQHSGFQLYLNDGEKSLKHTLIFLKLIKDREVLKIEHYLKENHPLVLANLDKEQTEDFILNDLQENLKLLLVPTIFKSFKVIYKTDKHICYINEELAYLGSVEQEKEEKIKNALNEDESSQEK